MAGLFKKIIGCFGLSKDDAAKHSAPQIPARFSVQVAVPTEREVPAPVVSECPHGAGGVQGLRWYAEKLKMDEDGDVAQEFLSEVSPRASGKGPDNSRSSHLVVKMHTRPVKLKGPVSTLDGNVHQCIQPSTDRASCQAV